MSEPRSEKGVGVRNPRFTPRLTGHASRRVHGLTAALRERSRDARAAALKAEDERAAAALRGKAVAFGEAARMAEAVERGWLMPWRRRPAAAVPGPTGETT
jgi:hypothetical protein